MELYIRIKDGQPFEHPILGDNFREVFPDIDVNNLPSEFAKFEKQDLNIGAYEIFDAMPYFIENGVCKNGRVRQMTPEEKQVKIDAIRNWWGRVGFASWVFNEATAEFEPPFPKPDATKRYRWSEDISNWVEVV